MVDLERTLLPTLVNHVKDWSRYVDDTIGIVKIDSIGHITNTLNSFHPNIQFTYEIEDNKMPFLDVVIVRNKNTLSTTVYRKPTNNDIYIHWDAFAPENWKRWTLRTLTWRAYTICSNDNLLQHELHHLRRSFNKINGFPHYILTQVFESVKRSYNTPPAPTLSTSPQITPPCDQEENSNTPNINLLILP